MTRPALHSRRRGVRRPASDAPFTGECCRCRIRAPGPDLRRSNGYHRAPAEGFCDPLVMVSRILRSVTGVRGGCAASQASLQSRTGLFAAPGQTIART